ncbi:uncharacterized protein LOC126175178 [Schistocerca cancellata]|uniref:uncharacterized protein LOC126175178 n=1 Tax=Schistocerca cancellata TaxID=274614 RepID=UPI0021194DBA|nr:uncharacterized protein LOC126175178 [Schistocerca cancellata]
MIKKKCPMMHLVKCTMLLILLAYAACEHHAENLERECNTQAQPRLGHRIQLLFPLLIAVAARLGALLPMAGSILTGVALMVVFAKVSLIVSTVTLLVSSLSAFQREEHYVVSIRQEGPYHLLNSQ